VWLPGNSHEKSEPGRLTALGLSRTMLMLQRWLTDVLSTLEPFGTKEGTRRVLLPRRVSFVERPRARGRGGLGSIIRRTAYLKMTLPPNRPLGQTLLLSAVVIGTAALDAVVVYAVTSWLWLVAHQGLH